MIRLLLLGRPSARADERDLGTLMAQPKRFAVLAFVAASGVFVSRDTLRALLWPEFDDERARAALRRALHFVRQVAADDVLATRGEEVALDSTRAWCDVPAFDAALRAGDHEAALALYRGDFLAGFHVDDAPPEFEQWLSGERSRLRDAALDAALAAARARAAAGDRVGAIGHAQRGVAIDPFDERAVRALMEQLAAGGSAASALRTFEEFATRSRDLLDVPPSQGTLVLAEALRAGTWRPPTASRVASPPAAVPIVAAEPPRRDRDQPLRTVVGAAPARDRRRRMSATAIVSLGILLTAVALARRHAARGDAARVLDASTIVMVLPFANRTGDAALAPFGSVAADWITQGLSRSGLVRYVTTQSSMLIATEGASRASSVDDVGGETFRLADAAGAGLIVVGSVAKQRDSLFVEAQVVDVADRRVRRAIPVVGGPASAPLALVSDVRQRVLAAIASLVDPRLRDLAEAGMQPPRWDSYLAYLDGMDHFVAGDDPGALERFTRATALDSSAALPLFNAAVLRFRLGDVAGADSLTRRLDARRDALSEMERVSLDWLEARLRGDRRAALEATRRAGSIAPGSFSDITTAGEALALGHVDETLGVLQRIDPSRADIRGWPSYWTLLIDSYHLVGDYARARASVARFALVRPDAAPTIARLAIADAALGDLRTVAVATDRLLALPDVDNRPMRGLVLLALELRAHGHVAEGDRVLRRAFDAAVDSSRRLRRRAGAEADTLALALAASGHVAEARALVSDDRHDSTSMSALGIRGLVAAATGDRSGAARYDALLAAYDGSRVDGYSTRLRAAIALRLGDRGAALALLRVAVTQGLGLHQLHPAPDVDALGDLRALLYPR